MSEDLRNSLKVELERYELLPKAKDVLVEDATKFYGEIAPEIKTDNSLKRKIALKLACDNNACAINPMPKKGVRHLTKARKITGVKQIFDPAERVGAQAKMLKNLSYIPKEAAEMVEIEATKIIREYQKRTGKIRESSNPYIDSASAIFIAGKLYGIHITQREIEDLFGVCVERIGTVSRKYADVLGIKITR